MDERRRINQNGRARKKKNETAGRIAYLRASCWLAYENQRMKQRAGLLTYVLLAGWHMKTEGWDKKTKKPAQPADIKPFVDRRYA
jgi:hypothetical protein